MTKTSACIRQLVVVLVEVTKYDRDGYLIQFYKGVLPCNTLAAMWSLTEAAFASPELDGLLCRVIAFNERTMRGGVNALQVMKERSAPDTRVVVGLVGIQTNQHVSTGSAACAGIQNAGRSRRDGWIPHQRFHHDAS